MTTNLKKIFETILNENHEDANLDYIEDEIGYELHRINRNVFDEKRALALDYSGCKKVADKEYVICVCVGQGFYKSDITEYFNFDEPIAVDGYEARPLSDEEAEKFAWSIPDYISFSGLRSSYEAHYCPIGNGMKSYCQYYKYTKV